ncbi:MAG TPA: hypothetical protein VK617_06155, partial [Gemmatimonadaceae bacterium]|nr:hypothetical protein [Gemmatimonadaceae bacterium]
TKLATLSKGQLMVRHPHFTQPIFISFPRPAVMRGRDGMERFPQAADVPLDVGVLRQLRRFEPSLTLAWVQDVIGLYEEEDVLRALHATLAHAPEKPGAYFKAQFRRIVGAVPAPAVARTPLRVLPDDDPYAI